MAQSPFRNRLFERFVLLLAAGMTLLASGCGGGASGGPGGGGGAGGAGGSQTTPTLSSIAVTPGNPSIMKGMTQQFTAMGTYSDGSTQNLTSSATWNSSASAVATIAIGGLASGVAAGSTTIMATSGSVSGTTTLTVTQPLPRFAYAANADGTVSIYTVNASTGQLRTNGYVLTGTYATSVAVDPSGKFVYVDGSNKVSAYVVNASTGALTEVLDSPVAAHGLSSLTVDPSGRFVYVTNVFPDSVGDNVSAYRIDASTGALKEVSGSPFMTGSFPKSMTVDPTGKFLYVANRLSDNIWGYMIDASTGALTTVAGSPFKTGSKPVSVAVDPSGNFIYVTNASPPTVSAYKINASTGILTEVSSSPTSIDPESVTVDPSGKFVYVANTDANLVSPYRIDASTGALTRADVAALSNHPVSMTADPSGKFIYVCNGGTSISAYGINPASGELDLLELGTAAARRPVSLALTSGTSPITYTPKFAYVANEDAHNVSSYSINSDGTLTSLGSPVPAGTNPFSVTVDPSGRFAYVPNAGSHSVSAYTLNSDGTLTSLGTPVAAGTNPYSLTVDPSGRFVYVANSGSDNVSCYSIGPDGKLAPLSNPVVTLTAGSHPWSVTVDPTGQFLYVANYANGFVSGTVSAYYINPNNGTLTLLGSPVATGMTPISVTVDPTGRYVYVANAVSQNISTYLVGGSNGLSPLGTVAAGNSPSSVTVDPSGRFVYVTDVGLNVNKVIGFRILFNGTLAPLGNDVATGTTPRSVTVDPSGKFVYVASSSSNDVSAYSMDSDGGLTLLGKVAAGTGAFSVTTKGAIQ